MNASLFTASQRLLAAVATAALLPLAVAHPAAAAEPAGAAGGARTGWASDSWLGASTTETGTTLASVRKTIGADSGVAGALTGKGVGVALIDTGVAPVPGIPAAQIVNGPDLSFESQADNLRYIDTFGHGTHMAGIILGNDTATGTKGLAPGVRLTSIKVGSATGAVDVSQMIAAIDWVVLHKNDDLTNPIRVLNLSYGTDSVVLLNSDAFHYAVEQAWRAGITVVAAAGNAGNDTGRLTSPATNARIVSVGAAATNGTVATTDDDVAPFTNLASGAARQVDVLAPGQSIASLRVPGSHIDNRYPGARTGTTLLRGSGTSQAAAVTSAAAALLLQARPLLTPDQVKSILIRGTALSAGKAGALGLRELNVSTALSLTPATKAQSVAWSTGLSPISLTRGSLAVMMDGKPLLLESTVWGPWHSQVWMGLTTLRMSWAGGTWMGARVAGDGWTGKSFAARTWGAAKWTTAPWVGGATWTDPSWNGRFWAGNGWNTGDWSGRFWAGGSWSTTSWG